MGQRNHAFALLAVMLLAAAPAVAGARTAPARQRRARPATLLAAGDIEGCQHGRPARQSMATARIIQRSRGTVAPLGDLDQGGQARLRDYRDCYGPAWGRFRARTRPALGNHDYVTPGAAGYFAYFGSRAGPAGRGYYSYRLGTWHIVVLNSSCQAAGGCGPGSRQDRWLRADLRAHRARCTLAYWHRPLISSAMHGDANGVRRLWQDLYAAGAEVVLNGHLHSYERFAPLTPYGRVNQARGIREFVVGTGGTRLAPIRDARPASRARNSTAHGVLRLTLGRGWYRWKFLPVAGRTYTDAGFARCH